MTQSPHQKNFYFQDRVENCLGMDICWHFLSTQFLQHVWKNISFYLFIYFLHHTLYTRSDHWSTHCFLVAGRKPTISIACCSLSKSWCRSSSSSILKFCYKEREIVSRCVWRWENESTRAKIDQKVKKRDGWKEGNKKWGREQRMLH